MCYAMLCCAWGACTCIEPCTSCIAWCSGTGESLWDPTHMPPSRFAASYSPATSAGVDTPGNTVLTIMPEGSAHACSEVERGAQPQKRWRPGVRSNRPARYLTQDVMHALRDIGAKWKRGAVPYNYKCCVSMPTAGWEVGPVAHCCHGKLEPPAPVATGDVCSSGGNIIGITLDSSGSVSSTNFDIARTQVC